jgi:hypothetical protein
MFTKGAAIGFASSKGRGVSKPTVKADSSPEEEPEGDEENQNRVDDAEDQAASRKRKRQAS